MATRQAAIGIGVGKVGDMPLLNGARSDASRFCEWADRNGYAAHPIIDGPNKPVRFSEIQEKIDAVIRGGVDRLIIFFSGHGTCLPEGDYWLLSEFMKSGDESVNVALSARAARRHPLRQVAIFADACRSSIPQGHIVNGRNLFFNPDHDSPREPRIDTFYATRPGAIAQERRNEDPTKSYGVFARCVFDALDGANPEAFERDRTPPVVSSDSLAFWLEEVVPLESGKIPGAQVQHPSVQPGWSRPDDWYVQLAGGQLPASPPPPAAAAEPAPPGKSLGTEAQPSPAAPSWDRPELVRRLGRWWRSFGARRDVHYEYEFEAPGFDPEASTFDPKMRVAIDRIAEQRRVAEHSERFRQSAGRESFETRQGFSVIGAEIVAAVGEPHRRIEHFLENGTWHVRCEEGRAQSVAIGLADGRWIGVATMPGFVGTIVVDDQSVLGIQFAPSLNTREHQEYQNLGTDQAMADWLALVSAGAAVPRERFSQLAEVWRQGKHRNPTLGILAAYAYDRAGDRESIDNIAWYFAARNQFVPFDVALLSKTSLSFDRDLHLFQAIEEGEARAWEARVAGAFPLMSAGWALIDEQAGLHPELKELRAGLRPGPWTSLDADRGARLAEMIASGELSYRSTRASEAEEGVPA